jgi:hypothetical protein
MKKSNRTNSLNTSLKNSQKAPISKDHKTPELTYSMNKDIEPINKKSAYSVYQYFNTKLKNNKRKSYNFEYSNSQITERTNIKVTQIKPIQNEKLTSKNKNSK